MSKTHLLLFALAFCVCVEGFLPNACGDGDFTIMLNDETGLRINRTSFDVSFCTEEFNVCEFIRNVGEISCPHGAKLSAIDEEAEEFTCECDGNNLLVNPSFETGDLSGWESNVASPGTQTGGMSLNDFDVVTRPDGTHKVGPTLTGIATSDRQVGDWASIQQWVDVSHYKDITLRFGAWYTQRDSDDTGRLEMFAYEGDTLLDSVSEGFDRNSARDGKWEYFTVNLTIPNEADQVLVRLEGTICGQSTCTGGAISVEYDGLFVGCVEQQEPTISATWPASSVCSSGPDEPWRIQWNRNTPFGDPTGYEDLDLSSSTFRPEDTAAGDYDDNYLFVGCGTNPLARNIHPGWGAGQDGVTDPIPFDQHAIIGFQVPPGEAGYWKITINAERGTGEFADSRDVTVGVHIESKPAVVLQAVTGTFTTESAPDGTHAIEYIADLGFVDNGEVIYVGMGPGTVPIPHNGQDGSFLTFELERIATAPNPQ